jgi:Ca-activated chloride channel family protein
MGRVNFSALSSAWLFALLIPLIIFYFLKLKRPRQVVSSLVLWRQVLSDQRVNSPFQRFKRNLLLLLQILLLALLALAAMQPFLRREAQRSERLPVLVDVSASMAALDSASGKSRLDEARQRLRDRIEALSPDQEMCVIAFAKTARKLTGFTNNKSELRNAAASLEVEELPGQLDDALRLAQALGRTAPFDRVLVLTDGNLPPRTNFELPFQLDLQTLPPAGPNAGITACQARRALSGDWEVFVQLAVTDPAPAHTATMTLRLGDREIAREQITLTAGGAPRLSFKVGGTQNDLVEVKLDVATFDSLAADNTAWLTLPASRSLDVFVPENLGTFRHALATVEGVRLFPSREVPAPGSYDLAITDQADPPSALVVCTTGFVPENLKSAVTIEKKSVGVVDWRRESPLLQHVSLDEVLFLEDPTTAPNHDETTFANLGYQILAQGQHGPLILAHANDVTGGGKMRVHFLFHPDRSTLPYRVAFPILVSNLVASAQKLAGLSEATAAATGVLPGQNVSPAAPVQVTGPGSFRWSEKADSHGIVSGIPASRVGEYVLSSGGSERRIGASLLSTSETTLAAIEEIEFGDRVSIATETASLKSDRSLWWTLAALGFAVLLVEWWWFQRRPF